MSFSLPIRKMTAFLWPPGGAQIIDDVDLIAAERNRDSNGVDHPCVRFICKYEDVQKLRSIKNGPALFSLSNHRGRRLAAVQLAGVAATSFENLGGNRAQVTLLGNALTIY